MASIVEGQPPQKNKVQTPNSNQNKGYLMGSNGTYYHRIHENNRTRAPKVTSRYPPAITFQHGPGRQIPGSVFEKAQLWEQVEPETWN